MPCLHSSPATLTMSLPCLDLSGMQRHPDTRHAQRPGKSCPVQKAWWLHHFSFHQIYIFQILVSCGYSRLQWSLLYTFWAAFVLLTSSLTSCSLDAFSLLHFLEILHEAFSYSCSSFPRTMSPTHLVEVLIHCVGMDVIISNPVLEDIISVSHFNNVLTVSLIHIWIFVIESLNDQKSVFLKFSFSVLLQPDRVEQAEFKPFMVPWP